MKDYTVMIESEGGTERELIEFDDIEEARRFCDMWDWFWEDENGFHWEMSIRDNRLDKIFAALKQQNA